MKTIEQAIFDAIIKEAQILGYDIYPSLPMEDVSYPFINMVSSQEIPSVTKTAIKGTYSFSLTIWGNDNQRKKIAGMAGNLRLACQRFLIGEHTVVMNQGAYTSSIMNETVSETSLLWRNNVSMEFILL